MKTAITFTCNGTILLVVLVVGWWLFKRLCGAIDCPECDGGTRRGWGPCPTCGPNDRINKGSNPTPRGIGIKAIGTRPTSARIGRTHGKGWHRDRGKHGLIS